jgi:hypothetical protein
MIVTDIPIKRSDEVLMPISFNIPGQKKQHVSLSVF